MKRYYLLIGLFLLTTLDCRAYIDPGSGSYYFQLLIGVLTGFVFFFHAIRRKVSGWVQKLFRGGGARSGKDIPNQTESRT